MVEFYYWVFYLAVFSEYLIVETNGTLYKNLENILLKSPPLSGLFYPLSFYKPQAQSHLSSFSTAIGTTLHSSTLIITISSVTYPIKIK